MLHIKFIQYSFGVSTQPKEAKIIPDWIISVTKITNLHFFFIFLKKFTLNLTGKSLSEALILASTNPWYDDRSSLNYKFITRKLQVQNMLCTQIVFVVFMYWTCNSMKNLLSYCGLVDARIIASEKDLPVHRFM